MARTLDHRRRLVRASWAIFNSLISINTAELNKAIAKSNLKYGFEVWESNPIGLCRRFHRVGGISTWCYFASVAGSKVPYPVDGTPWFSELQAIRWLRDTRSTREEFEQVVPSTAVTDDAGSAKRLR